jgi:serine/threonine protein phosphatase 1
MIIFGDVHGCFDTLMALLDTVKKEHPNDQIVFVGDLIDRGPKSKEVVEFVKSNKFPCVMGNHEHMMLYHYDRNRCYDYSLVWLQNGGDEALKSYDGVVSKDHLNWIEKLPLYLEFDETNEKGESLFISHSAVMPYGPLAEYDLDRMADLEKCPINNSIIWFRGKPAKLKDKFHVFGHTPVRNPDIGDYFANIDTGCVYSLISRIEQKRPLTALHFPSMKIYQQECIDEKLEEQV